MIYKFSVGNLVILKNGIVVKEITTAREITVDYRITTHKEYGPEGQVIDEVVETEELGVSCEFADSNFGGGLDVGEYYDIQLELGGPLKNTGIELTLANCRITGYSIRTTQGEFVTSTLTFSKVGKLTDPIGGGEPTKQRVRFGLGDSNDVYIGDTANVDISYEGHVIEYIIPTALGIGLMSTQTVGGGKLTIVVKGYVKKNTRLEIEQYLLNLYSLLLPSIGKLTVEYGLSSYSIPNVYFSRGTPGIVGKYGTFTLEFIKSAY